MPQSPFVARTLLNVLSWTQLWSKSACLQLAAKHIIGLVNFCFQHVFLRRISAYSLSVAMASYLDSPFCNLHHILPGSCHSKTALDREGRSISRVCAAKLSYAERVLLANLLVFRGPSTNGDPSLGQVKTLSSFSKVIMLF